jgi:hypothetical protein
VLAEENTESGWYSFKTRKKKCCFGDILLKNIWRFKIFVIPLRSKDK